MKPFIRFISLGFVAGVLLNCSLYAQDDSGEDSTDQINSAIDSQEYVFIANTALPQRGRSIHLTSRYDLMISKDSIVAYLPYFGRAYSAPIGTTDSGIKFTSTDFEYTVNKRKKGRWQIEIKPNDVQSVQQLSLSVSRDGYANLQVTSTNRQSISFNGNVTTR